MTNPWRRTGRPLVIAHRGNSIDTPENTIIAYERAIELGCEAIEADVHLTADGTLVMLHDNTLDRTTDGRGPVRDLPWSTVRALDAGSWMDPRFAGTRIPTTVEFLDLTRRAGIPVCLEIKGADAEEYLAIADVLARLLADRPDTERIFVSSYDHAALARVRSVLPGILLAPERLPDEAPADPPATVRQALELRAEVIQHMWHLLTEELVSAVHATDTALWSWTTNTPESVALSARLGADAVMGDDVVTMIETLDKLEAGSPGIGSDAGSAPVA